MSELIAQPELMKRAQEEVDSVVGFDRVVEESDVPNLPYLAAVIKETFRLHPPLPWLLPHSCRVDCKVNQRTYLNMICKPIDKVLLAYLGPIA